MKTFLVLICAALLTCGFSFAQCPPDTLWTKTYGGASYDGAGCVQQTTDGGYIIAGTTRSFGLPGGNNMYLVRTNGSGDTMWTRTYGGTFSDGANAVQQTTDGGYVLAGYTSSFGAGNSDFYLVKTNSFGDTVWTRTYGGSDYDAARCVQQTADGGYVIVGTTRSFGAGYYDFWLVKTNSQGQTSWTRTYGGSSSDEGQSVQQTVDGGYILAGWTSGVDSDDAYLVRTNSSGDTLWTRTYGGTDWDHVLSVQQTVDGGYIAAGCSQQFYLLRTTSMGDTMWSRRYGGVAGAAYSVQQTPDDGYIAAGYSYSLGQNLHLVRTNSVGDTLWTRTYGGAESDIAYSIQRTSDGGYIVAGITSSFGAGDYDLYLLKIGPDAIIRIESPNGAEEWHILQTDTVHWCALGFDSVRIELSRNYPSGAWELLASSTPNDGEEAVLVTAPPTDHCRVRVSAIGDTLSDVSDADFSIVSSQGYLALVRPAQPTVPVTSWNAGTVECPQMRCETFCLKNFGSEPIVVFQPEEPTSVEFLRITNCATYFALSPGQMSSCSVRVCFDPNSDGTYRDTLKIMTDAVNQQGGYVRIPLSGTQISTPASPQVVIAIEGVNARLSWQPIALSIGGCPVSVNAYLVFYSPTLAGPYYYHGYTSDTTYVHAGVVQFASGQFYNVSAYTGLIGPLTEIRPETTQQEVEALLRER